MTLDDSSYSDEEKDLVSRYEQQLSSDGLCYMDEDEYVVIFDHYINDDLFDKCATLLQIAEGQHPYSADIMDCRARLCAAKGDFTQALNIIESALKIDHQNADILLTKGKILLHTNKRKEAEAIFKQVIQLDDSELDDSLVEIGIAYHSIDDFTSAIRYLNEAVRLNPQNEEALFELGMVYDAAGEKDTAIQYLEKVLDINPYSGQTWSAIGNIYFNNDEYDKAIDPYDYACTINSKDTYSLLQKAHSLFGNNQFQEAIEVYEEYTDLMGETTECLNSIGECYENLGNLSTARDMYLRGVELDPNNYFGLANLCVVNLNMENYKEALKWIKEVLKIENSKPEYYMLEGESYVNLGKKNLAIKSYQKAFDIDNSQVFPLIAIGNLYFDSQNYPKALDYLEKAFGINPDAEDLKFFLALTYYELGEKKEAIAFYLAARNEKEEVAQLFREFIPEITEDPDFKDIL